MLIAAASLAAILVTTASASSAAEAADAPALASTPMIVSVTAASDISSTLVTAVLREADAVWRAAGFRFIWERNATFAPAALHVIIGGGRSTETNVVPMAWISFDEDGQPAPRIYVSHGNAVALMANSRETVGLVESMTILQKDTYLARAMGRALAHEIGHYLLASSKHSSKGLMMATHSSAEFFSIERRGFAINAVERQQMAARFASISVASRG